MASQETRFAVFGDSYVRRQGAFTRERLPYNVRFFGKGGMELLRIPTEEWNRLLNYKPDVVLLHLGGNDVRDPPVDPKKPRGENIYVGANNQARVLFDAMNRRIKELTRLGIKVMVGQVLDRADWALRGVGKETFDLVRKGLNRRLRDLLGHNFIFFRVHLWDRSGKKIVNYHYSQKDGVHLSERGMTCYEKVLKKEFARPSFHKV